MAYQLQRNQGLVLAQGRVWGLIEIVRLDERGNIREKVKIAAVFNRVDLPTQQFFQNDNLCDN